MKLARHPVGISLALAALVPAGASAATANFFSTDQLAPSGGTRDRRTGHQVSLQHRI
jgi:hypothetical protein